MRKLRQRAPPPSLLSRKDVPKFKSLDQFPVGLALRAIIPVARFFPAREAFVEVDGKLALPGTKSLAFSLGGVRSLAARVFQFAPNGSVARKIRDCRDLPRRRARATTSPVVMALEAILVSISKRVEPNACFKKHV